MTALHTTARAPATVITASLLTCLSACDTVVLPHLKRYPGVDYTFVEPSRSYCHRLAKTADDVASAYLGTGIALALVAGGTIVVGAVVGPDTSSGASWAGTNRNALIVAAGGLLAIPAVLLLMRSRDASTASADAGRALTFDDSDEGLDKCLAARAEFVNARGAMAEAVRADLVKRAEQLEKARVQVKKAADRTTNPDEKKELQGVHDALEQQQQQVLEALQPPPPTPPAPSTTPTP